MIDYFLQKMQENPSHQALAASGFSASYKELIKHYNDFVDWLLQNDIPQGAVVSFDGDYSPQSISLLLALTINRNIIVPLSRDSRNHFTEFREIASTEYDISLSGDSPAVTITGRKAEHSLYNELKQRESAGLVLFSSGYISAL